MAGKLSDADEDKVKASDKSRRSLQALQQALSKPKAKFSAPSAPQSAFRRTIRGP